MDKRTPEDIRKSIKTLVEEAENVSVVQDEQSANQQNSKESFKSKSLLLRSI